ncbi:SGNH/GDSL hydrolase family protein [Schlesneria paludicola]|uniref:SGNH/GDSL hydrolase family protein n=1 Tax=Schlesneria paludicola TaxID=360056 RepID=UPI00029A1000|nr:SGNH/GDSL hydrolase family protein [Schlesneria paludicola]
MEGLQHDRVSGGYITLDWTASGGRKRRLYRLEVRNGSPNLRGIYVDTSSTVWSADDANRVRGVMIADSIWAGANFGPFIPGGSVCNLLSHEMGWNDLWDFAQGGTGYVNRGNTPGAGSETYGYRVPQALLTKPDVWLLMGTTNDQNNYSTFQAAVTSAIAAIRAGSSAPIVIFGLWSINDTSWTVGQKIADFEDFLKAAVASFSDPNIFFVPVRNDPTGPWITGTWNNGFNTNSTNATAYIASDNVHPPDPGTQYLAARVAQALRQQILPNLI